MKKKIKDLTLQECKAICRKHACNNECPFYSAYHSQCKFLITVLIDEDEVEVEERKELTPLEAVKILKEYWDNLKPLSCPQGLKLVSIIEKAVKRSEELEIMYSNCVIEDAIQKKALEIFLKKNIDINYLRDSKDLDHYNASCDYHRNLDYLTQEEYDILKKELETWYKKQH